MDGYVYYDVRVLDVKEKKKKIISTHTYLSKFIFSKLGNQHFEDLNQLAAPKQYQAFSVNPDQLIFELSWL